MFFSTCILPDSNMSDIKKNQKKGTNNLRGDGLVELYGETCEIFFSSCQIVLRLFNI